MRVKMQSVSLVALLASLTGFAVSAAAEPTATTGEQASYVEFVRCESGVCQPQHRKVPVVEVLREREAGGFCSEYSRRLTGFVTYPSADPAVQIQVPQFELTPRRSVRCGSEGPVAVVRQGSQISILR